MKKAFLTLGVFLVATVIFLISILNSSEITYTMPDVSESKGLLSETPMQAYSLPDMGNVLPDNPLWKFKVFRDRIWFDVTTSHLRRAKLSLLFADKRLAMTEYLFRAGKIDLGIITYQEGEGFLPVAVSEEKIARGEGIDTTDFLYDLALSSIIHDEIANRLIQLAPDDKKTLIEENMHYARETFDAASNALISAGLAPPKSPFDGE